MSLTKIEANEVREIAKKIDSITALIEGLQHFNESMVYVRQAFFVLMKSDGDIKQAIIRSLEDEREKLFREMGEI
jgi:hypothetical protein